MSGCVFQNLSAETRLRDAVVGYNDETRWVRLDLAVQRVAPMFRESFRQMHHRWGNDIQIADLDIVHVETAGEDRDHATSHVMVRWYAQNGMILATTKLTQEWRKIAGGYVMISEVVSGGDDRLLEIPVAEEEPGDDNPELGIEEETELADAR